MYLLLQNKPFWAMVSPKPFCGCLNECCQNEYLPTLLISSSLLSFSLLASPNVSSFILDFISSKKPAVSSSLTEIPKLWVECHYLISSTTIRQVIKEFPNTGFGGRWMNWFQKMFGWKRVHRTSICTRYRGWAILTKKFHPKLWLLDD